MYVRMYAVAFQECNDYLLLNAHHAQSCGLWSEQLGGEIRLFVRH